MCASAVFDDFYTPALPWRDLCRSIFNTMQIARIVTAYACELRITMLNSVTSEEDDIVYNDVIQDLFILVLVNTHYK